MSAENLATPGSGLHSYNEVLPLMMVRYCAPGLLGLGITALIAGFMSGMAGNVTAFSAVWTYDIYQPLINKNAKDEHYVTVGRWATLLGVIVSIGTAYLVMSAAGHHGLCPGAFQLLHLAFAGRGADGHVLEARNQSGRLLGTADRHVDLDRTLGMGLYQSRGTALCSPLAGRQGHGRGYVPRLVVGHHLRAGHLRGEPVYQARPLAELDGVVYGATILPIEEPVPFYKNEWVWTAIAIVLFLGLNIYFW